MFYFIIPKRFIQRLQKQVIAWGSYSSYDSFHSIDFRTFRQLWAAKAIPCLKAIHLPLTAGLSPSRAWSGSFLACF